MPGSRTGPTTGQLELVLYPSKFQKPETLKAEVDRHIRSLRKSEALPGSGPVRLPGDQRAKRRADRAANGLMLPKEVLVQLDKLAAELSINPLSAR